MNKSEVEMAKVGKEGDLVVRWFDNSLDFQSRLRTPRNLMVSVYAEGHLPVSYRRFCADIHSNHCMQLEWYQVNIVDVDQPVAVKY